MAGLFTLRVFFEKSAEKGNRQRNIFLPFVLMPDLGYKPRALRLISQHTNYWTMATSLNLYLFKIPKSRQQIKHFTDIRRNIFFLHFVLMPDLGYEPWALRLISQHTNY